MTTATATPASKTTRKPRAKKDRRIKSFDRMLSGTYLLCIEEKAGPKSEPVQTHYYVTERPADFGRGILLEKFTCQGGESYAVNIADADNPASCECLGHLKHGHKTVCKHVAAARALIATGKL
jgi:hypothetical protein